MKLFDIYVSLKGHSFSYAERLEFESEEKALEYARLDAEGLYCWNPERDIFDIMEQDKVNEDIALRTFNKEKDDMIIYHIAEVTDEQS